MFLQALKCLWKSLLNIVLHNDAREVCYPFIGKVLEKFSQVVFCDADFGN